MEDIISYVILFAFGLTALILYQKHRTKQRNLPLSVQHFPDLILEVIIQKQYGKTQNLIVKTSAKNVFTIAKISVELIDKKRKIEIVEIKTDKIDKTSPIKLNDFEQHHFKLNPEHFQEFLQKQEIPFSTFRFIVENADGKRFKSHDLAFNKNWSIFKPDSGTYN